MNNKDLDPTKDEDSDPMKNKDEEATNGEAPQDEDPKDKDQTNLNYEDPKTRLNLQHAFRRRTPCFLKTIGIVEGL